MTVFSRGECKTNGYSQKKLNQHEPTPGSSPQIPTAPSWPAPGGPTSQGGHVSTFGMASPAASSPVSAEVQHCALPMAAPSFGGRQQNTTGQSQCWAKIFRVRKRWEPPQQLRGCFFGRGVSDMILETPQNILGFLIVFSSHWSSLVIGLVVLSRCAVLILHSK